MAHVTFTGNKGMVRHISNLTEIVKVILMAAYVLSR